MSKTIGILAVQGGFAEHLRILRLLGAAGHEIRQARQLTEQRLDGLILPGGESTAIGKLLRDNGLLDLIRQRILSGLPVWGTCAGMILLAARLVDDRQVHIGTMDIAVRRNAFGRQSDSFFAEGEFAGHRIPMTFIRAPLIEQASNRVAVLATMKGRIVAARQDKMLVTSFHPELTDDLTVHEYFLGKICTG